MFTYNDVLKSCLEYYGGDLLAASTAAKKYLLRDKQDVYVEATPEDMHTRLATEFARVEKKMNPACNEAEYFKRVYGLLRRFNKVCPQGSPMSGIGNPFYLQSLSNCFVVASPSDDIPGIFHSGLETASIQKRRGGVGMDLSTLRPYGSKVNNAADISSGLPCFSDFYSYITRMVGQKGRQGALMLTCHVKHPDVARYAVMKQDLTKVTGANISIKITDEFMRAVEEDAEFTQQWPIDVPLTEAKVVSVVRARELWNTIVEAAWKSAEPGLLMWDNICNNLPAHCYPDFLTMSTNPCAELPLSAYDSCRLISNNLSGWVEAPFTKEAHFDFATYFEDTKIAQRMSDGLVEMEIEVIDRILEISDGPERTLWQKIQGAAVMGRRTGLGTHALADTFLALGLRYDSAEARQFAHKAYQTHRDASYWESVNMARERGPFPVWQWEMEKDNAFIQRLDPELRAAIQQFGRRNISNLTLAPTGSLAIVSQTSSGCEAVFAWVADRFVKQTHEHLDLPVDRVDAVGDKWTKYRVLHPAVRAYLDMNGLPCPVKDGRDFSQSLDEVNAQLKATLPAHFVTSDQIDYVKGVELQGVIQEYIDHGVSRTINMPRGSTREQVEQVYLQAWKLGLKGVTVYVDGSRDGVLIATDKKEKAKEQAVRPDQIVESHAPKRPKSLEADVHHVKVKGQDWAVVVGLLGGAPFEVFAGQGLVLPKSGNIEAAFIKKVNSKSYSLVMQTKDGPLQEDLREIYDNPEQRVITRGVCRDLRHGIPVEFIVRDLQEYEGSLVDYTAVLARVLKKYAKSAKGLIKSCPQCGGTEFKLVEACPTCCTCSWSKCG